MPPEFLDLIKELDAKRIWLTLEFIPTSPEMDDPLYQRFTLFYKIRRHGKPYGRGFKMETPGIPDNLCSTIRNTVKILEEKESPVAI